ncbi:DUF4314 domain-containing protein [uncultured Oscillibacter sp.]|uniref:DUF4314 domain-containing protein n=1 Tax=uncultured Oscillibacter sp. TaxID=876091 RepID=UPI0025F455A1|nr:DUF4314 domain-containing protein [uncultured Oscillibacter sp.]
MTVDQNWLKFMREQYPQGSRIRLREMKDPYNPVEPGTMGTLNFIDDIGTFHCTWDNGRTLGLVMGEDSFSVLPLEPTLLKLYMPMTVTYYERNDYGDLENDELTMDSHTATSYANTIADAILRERRPEESERGLMKYYGEHDGVEQKVRSLQFAAETRDGMLWGVAECSVVGELTPEELELLKDYVSGQASDGFGEGFEQHTIKFGDGEMYAHLWNCNNSWRVQTEQELFSPKLAEGLPETCLSTMPGSGTLIVIKRGESGYYPSDWDTGDPAKNREIADEHNQRRGITPAQEQAMQVGSMFGWEVPGADPKAYEQAPQMGGMTLG